MNKIFHQRVNYKTSFTVIELLVVMVIVMLLISVVIVVGRSIIQDAKIKRTAQDLIMINKGIAMYYDDYESYPPEEDKALPPKIQNYFVTAELPKGQWNDTCYDWDNWDDPDTGAKIYQISLRFCCSYSKKGKGGGEGSCKPPINDFDRYSAIYYCIQGACRSHISKLITHPGLCVNCGEVL